MRQACVKMLLINKSASVEENVHTGERGVTGQKEAMLASCY